MKNVVLKNPVSGTAILERLIVTCILLKVAVVCVRPRINFFLRALILSQLYAKASSY